MCKFDYGKAIEDGIYEASKTYVNNPVEFNRQAYYDTIKEHDGVSSMEAVIRKDGSIGLKAVKDGVENTILYQNGRVDYKCPSVEERSDGSLEISLYQVVVDLFIQHQESGVMGVFTLI